MINFTPQGLQIESLDEVLAVLVDAYRDIYGADINLDQDTPDGQRVGIEAKARHDLQELALSIANSFDPDLAEGRWLASIAKISGLKPRPGSRSQWDLQVTTDRNLTLPAGYTVSDSGQTWVLDTPVDVTAGQSVVTFFAAEYGLITGSSGAAIEQSTVVLGVKDVIATGDAVVGSPAESDAEFRQRRNRGVQNPAYSVVGGLNARLNNLPNVTEARVYENDLNTTANGMPPHSIWAIIEGGSVSDIVEALVKYKTAGVLTVGSLSGNYVETIPRTDRTPIIITHVMNFDRPDYVDVDVKLTAKRHDATVPIDQVIIAQSIAAQTFHIGETMQASVLYKAAYSVAENATLTDLQVNDGSGWTAGQIVPGLGQLYRINVVTVTDTI